jgi:alkylated DNA repair dioxygenase AlkB
MPTIPPYLARILERVPRAIGREELPPPNQVTVNVYPPGTGIPPHVDADSLGEQIASISLGSPAVMELTGPKGEMVEADMARGSLLVMSGEVRWGWRHGIRSRKVDILGDGSLRSRGTRVSITLRWVTPPVP